MSFAERFLTPTSRTEDPARLSHAFGSQEAGLELPGGPVAVLGMQTDQADALRERYGAFGCRTPGSEAAALEIRATDPSCFVTQREPGELYDMDLRPRPQGADLAGPGFLAEIDWPGKVPRATVWTLPGPMDAFLQTLENVLRVMLAFRLRAQNAVLLHSSAVVHEGRAAIFLGTSGAGKTTMARLAQEQGLEVLSDDLNAVLSLTGPTPVVAKLPLAGELKSDLLPRAPTQLGACFRLEKSDSHGLEGISTGQAVAGLAASSCSVNAHPWLQEELLGDLASLVGQVPTYRLAFRKDRSVWDLVLPVLEDPS